MARVRGPAISENGAAAPKDCAHGWVAIRLGGPESWRACDPRLGVIQLPPDSAGVAAEAREGHLRDGNWPEVLVP